MKKPMTPPDVESLVNALLSSGDADAFRDAFVVGGLVDGRGRYLHWDDLRYREPPRGLTHEDWWLGTWLSRAAFRRPVPLRSVDGQLFNICMVDPVWEALHRIDRAAEGGTSGGAPTLATANSDRYVVRSLIEEAVASSQLEGASTTRREAKKMLLSGRAPRDRSEQMIFNNFMAMSQVRSLARGNQPLTPGIIYELHRRLTVETLEDPDDAGRIQGSGEERVRVWWPSDAHNQQPVHTPPPAAELPERLAALCAFANSEGGGDFLHPVVRAIVLHFWLAYDHPFVDGNGRLARSLFYWSMLRSGYWMAEFLAVSAILRQAPAQYARSYLLTETDNNDLTYFVYYQLGVIERAIEALRVYLKSRVEEVREIDGLLHDWAEINHRQRVALATALRDPSAEFDIRTHQITHAVAYQTARTDLLGLASRGLFATVRDGRSYRFLPATDLAERIRGIAADLA